MAFTPEQLAKIRQKEDSLPAAFRRDTLTNYREGYFFITLNTRNASPILSTLAGSPTAPDGSPDAPRCVYTELGERVKECWNNIPKFYPFIEIIGCEAMPDHFHGLLKLKAGGKAHLGQIVRGFMIGCTHAYWDTLGIAWRQPRSVITQDCRDRDHTRSFRGPALFVRGYNDVEALTAAQVETKLRYIREQARRALIKRHTYECFHIHRNTTARSWTADALYHALLHDRYIARDANRMQTALQQLRPRIPLHPTCGKPTLSYIGSANILAATRKLPLICHRADAALFEKQKAAVMQAAREGAVIVSAFISSKEREVKKQLLAEMLPVIEVTDNGFADRYKPSGKAFYACAENRLVQISPWTYEYSRDTKVTRNMCMVMNQLVRVITCMHDDWWKN